MRAVDGIELEPPDGVPRNGGDQLAQLRAAAARHREAAKRFYALARDCRAHADQIMFQEFGRREWEAGLRLELCADQLAEDVGPRIPGEIRT